MVDLAKGLVPQSNSTTMIRFVFLIILFEFLILSNSWSQDERRICPDVGSSIALKKNRIELNRKGYC